MAAGGGALEAAGAPLSTASSSTIGFSWICTCRLNRFATDSSLMPSIMALNMS
jgi:hypothetical protein